jgi:deazaflavin-dependent oxidoreductase (nitroreductase family)
VKHRIVHVLQKYLLNPPIRLLFALQMVPPGYALLETRGRASGRPRRTPVGNGVEGQEFWIVTEHGFNAGYVRNIQHDPRVRVRFRHGLRLRWRGGNAQILPDDDPRERQRTLGKGHPLRGLNALAVRGMGTELLSIRIDLDPATESDLDAST